MRDKRAVADLIASDKNWSGCSFFHHWVSVEFPGIDKIENISFDGAGWQCCDLSPRSNSLICRRGRMLGGFRLRH